MKLLLIAFSIFFAGCSQSPTQAKEPPSLGDLLLGTYVDVSANYLPDRNVNQFGASTTDSTNLTINPNGSYTMRIDLYAEDLDRIIYIYQEGSYITNETQYVKGECLLCSSYWKGTIKFRPEGATEWGGDFTIGRSRHLAFVHHQYIELPNSIGSIAFMVWWRTERKPLAG